MSNKKLSMMINVEQQKIKPSIEDVAPELLDGENLQIVLDFSNYMRQNKNSLRWGGIVNTWKSMYKGKPLCYLRLAQPQYAHMRDLGDVELDRWVLTLYLNNMETYKDLIFKESWEELIWNGFNKCRQCDITKECCNAQNKIILGKELKGICVSFFSGRIPVDFVNPDRNKIEILKKIMTFEKNARKELK